MRGPNRTLPGKKGKKRPRNTKIRALSLENIKKIAVGNESLNCLLRADWRSIGAAYGVCWYRISWEEKKKPKGKRPRKPCQALTAVKEGMY